MGDNESVEYAEWVSAVEHVDQSETHDTAKLVKALRNSALPMVPLARLLLADLLERYELRHPPHRPRRPIYLGRTDQEVFLDAAADEVRRLQRQPGVSKEKAIDLVAADFEIDVNILENRVKHRRGWTRRRP